MKNDNSVNSGDSNEMPVMESFEAYIVLLLANTKPGILYCLTDGADFLVPPEGGGESAASSAMPEGRDAALRFSMPQVPDHDGNSVQDPPIGRQTA